MFVCVRASVFFTRPLKCACLCVRVRARECAYVYPSGKRESANVTDEEPRNEGASRAETRRAASLLARFRSRRVVPIKDDHTLLSRAASRHFLFVLPPTHNCFPPSKSWRHVPPASHSHLRLSVGSSVTGSVTDAAPIRTGFGRTSCARGALFR